MKGEDPGAGYRYDPSACEALGSTIVSISHRPISEISAVLGIETKEARAMMDAGDDDDLN